MEAKKVKSNRIEKDLFVEFPVLENKIEDAETNAENYVVTFWYEQSEKIKAKLRMAFRAGYLFKK